MLTVGPLLSREVVTVSPDTSVEQARLLLRQHEFHHLPVVERGRIVGLVSHRDLLTRSLPEPLRSTPASTGPEDRVRERMHLPVETLTVDEPVSTACRRMCARRISSLPVLEEGRLTGILTERDLLRLYVRLCRYVGPDPALDPPVQVAMSPEPVTIEPEASLARARETLLEVGVRHLPVVHDGWLVGVLSEVDLLPMVGRPEHEVRQVGDVMARDFARIETRARLSEAARRMLEDGIHALPVVVGGALRGIVTSHDVLIALGKADEGQLESAWHGATSLSAEAEER